MLNPYHYHKMICQTGNGRGYIRYCRIQLIETFKHI